LTQTLQKLKEAKEEGEQIRADCQAMIKQYQVNSFLYFNNQDDCKFSRIVQYQPIIRGGGW
jgi:hypothetical protein